MGRRRNDKPLQITTVQYQANQDRDRFATWLVFRWSQKSGERARSDRGGGQGLKCLHKVIAREHVSTRSSHFRTRGSRRVQLVPFFEANPPHHHHRLGPGVLSPALVLAFSCVTYPRIRLHTEHSPEHTVIHSCHLVQLLTEFGAGDHWK
jgi:hypothetical protein